MQAGTQPGDGSSGAWTPTVATHGGGAWDALSRQYMANPLPVPQRVALLCAALEGPGPYASPLHATGLTLLGQEETHVDLEAAWTSLAQGPDGRGLLRATARIGQGQDADPADLEAAHRHLGPWIGAWRDVVCFAAGSEAQRRCLGSTLHPSGHAGLDAWLAQVVQARRALDGVLGP